MADHAGRTLIIQEPDTGNPGQFLHNCGFVTRDLQINSNRIEEMEVDCTTPGNAPDISAFYGAQSVVFSGSGKLDDGDRGIAIANAAINQQHLEGWKVIIPGVGSYTGKWMVENFSFSGDAENRMQFSCTISKAGSLTFAPVA